MNNMVITRTPISFRIFVTVFSLLLGLQAAWLLSAELTRVSLPFFPTDKTEIEYASAKQDQAASAALLGWLRGDLWADYALAADSRLLTAATTNDKAELVSDRAVAHAPYDARLWLLLAAINAHAGRTDDKTIAQLNMSFYTSPNDTRLMPLRLRIATQFQAMTDDELQNLIEHEIRAAQRKPELKPMIAAAYREASPAGRQFIEAKLTVLDPKFLSDLRSNRP